MDQYLDPTWWGYNSLVDNLALDDPSISANFGCFDADSLALSDCSVLDKVYPLCAIPCKILLIIVLMI